MIIFQIISSLLALGVAFLFWINYQKSKKKNELERLFKSLESENTRLKASEISLADANVKMALLYEEIEMQKSELENSNRKLEKSNEQIKEAHEQVVASEEELRQTIEELVSINEQMVKTQKELKFANQKLQENERELEQKVESRTQEFLIAKQNAERANKVKSEFLANMSHELRTPLNAILGYGQILLNSKQLNNEVTDKIKIINKSGEHLLELINSVLDLSKIEAGRMELIEKTFDLPKLIRQVFDMFKLKCESKGIELKVELLDDIPVSVIADEGKIRQCIINLVGNAVKFTSQGSVFIQVKKDSGDRFTFLVRDTGRGIPKDKIKDVLEPFTQIQAHQNTEGGTGLGLAITKSYIQLMGGKMSVESEEGRGSSFYFTIPLKLSQDDVSTTLYADHKIIGFTEQGIHVLVVDDNQINRDVAKNILESVGLMIELAHDGAEAILKATEQSPKIILMDIRMPGINGLDATKIIRETDIGKTVKIIAVTASAFEQDRDKFLLGGCDSYLSKPYKSQELLAEIAKLLNLTPILEKEKTEEIITSDTIDFKAVSQILGNEFIAEFEDHLMCARLEKAQAMVHSIQGLTPTITHFKSYANTLIDEINYDELDQLVVNLKN